MSSLDQEEVEISFVVKDWKDILRYLRSDFRTPQHILKAIEGALKDYKE